MKIIYLFAPIEQGCVGPSSGIERKVRAQVGAMNSFNGWSGEAIECDLVILSPVEYEGTVTEKLIRRLPWTAAWRKWKYCGEFNDADILYIRKVYEDNSFIKYLKAIKKENPKIRIIYEIPTYPEKTAVKNLSNYFFQKKEDHAKRKLKKYVNKIVTFYDQDEIYGIPCIKLINGYDFSKVELPFRERANTVKLLSVAINAQWHGYERLIKGIEDYYANGGTEQIVYHVVGTPLREYGESNDHVILHGPLFGDELKALYNECLVGIDVLGGHRKDYPVSSSLKSREYAAYGLPMVTSSPIDYLPKDYPYQFIVPYDDSHVDIKALLKWYHSIYDGKDCNEIASSIRDFAFDHCDMRFTMRPVLDFCIQECRF